MNKGESRITNLILRVLDNDTKEEINNFIDNLQTKTFYNITTYEEILKLFREEINNFTYSLSKEEQLNIKFYSGYYYKFINSILRDNWNYEENGKLDDNTKEKYKKIANSIKDSLTKFPILPINLYTYRGTSIDTFKEYNIHCLEDLIYLNGKYFYERGFTSTSVLEENSYYNQPPDESKQYNIKIKYLIPEYCNDGAIICNNVLSYSPNQTEYLITSGSLFKVIDVNIKNNEANITMALVPNKIYEKDKVKKH